MGSRGSQQVQEQGGEVGEPQRGDNPEQRPHLEELSSKRRHSNVYSKRFLNTQGHGVHVEDAQLMSF